MALALNLKPKGWAGFGMQLRMAARRKRDEPRSSQGFTEKLAGPSNRIGSLAGRRGFGVQSKVVVLASRNEDFR